MASHMMPEPDQEQNYGRQLGPAGPRQPGPHTARSGPRVISVTADPAERSMAIIRFSEPVLILGQDGRQASAGNPAKSVQLSIFGLTPNEQGQELDPNDVAAGTYEIWRDFTDDFGNPVDIRGMLWEYPSNSAAVTTADGRPILGGNGQIPRMAPAPPIGMLVRSETGNTVIVTIDAPEGVTVNLSNLIAGNAARPRSIEVVEGAFEGQRLRRAIFDVPIAVGTAWRFYDGTYNITGTVQPVQ